MWNAGPARLRLELLAVRHDGRVVRVLTIRFAFISELYQGQDLHLMRAQRSAPATSRRARASIHLAHTRTLQNRTRTQQLFSPRAHEAVYRGRARMGRGAPMSCSGAFVGRRGDVLGSRMCLHDR
jgi:hypothetical protein